MKLRNRVKKFIGGETQEFLGGEFVMFRGGCGLPCGLPGNS